MKEIDFDFSSLVQITDGKVNTAVAEEEFYSYLRNNEKHWIQDAIEEELSDLLNGGLTKEQQDRLKEAHMAQYRGTDDDAPDDYENWLTDLSLEEIKTIAKV